MRAHAKLGDEAHPAHDVARAAPREADLAAVRLEPRELAHHHRVPPLLPAAAEPAEDDKGDCEEAGQQLAIRVSPPEGGRLPARRLAQHAARHRKHFDRLKVELARADAHVVAAAPCDAPPAGAARAQLRLDPIDKG